MLFSAAFFFTFHFNSLSVYGVWNECAHLFSPITLTHLHTHPTQTTSPPTAVLLSLLFRHTALEVSPAISGTSCCPAGLALFLRAQGNTATLKRPAAAPVTSGSPAFRNSQRRSQIRENANLRYSEFSYVHLRQKLVSCYLYFKEEKHNSIKIFASEGFNKQVYFPSDFLAIK